MTCNVCGKRDHLGFCDDIQESKDRQRVRYDPNDIPPPRMIPEPAAQQKTGGSVDYYKCHVADPISKGEPYTAESIDIIEALGMTFAEGEAFKAIWRTCTGRMVRAAKRSEAE